MNKLKKWIDNGSWSAIDENDEMTMTCLSFSICGKFSCDNCDSSHTQLRRSEFHDPFPTQYCILRKKPECLKQILDLLLIQGNTSIVDIFQSALSNTKLPLIHLAIVTMNTECLETLINYLNRLLQFNEISSENYNTILNMNSNYRYPPQTGKYFRHTALYYSLNHFESFEILIRLAKADPFIETIEEDNGDTAVINPNKKISAFMSLITRVHSGTFPKIMDLIKKEFPKTYREHITTMKYNPETFQVDQSGGKTLKEILESMEEFPNGEKWLIKESLLNVLKPALQSAISIEDVSGNQQTITDAVITESVRGDNRYCAFSDCDQIATDTCNICHKKYCGEHIDHGHH